VNRTPTKQETATTYKAKNRIIKAATIKSLNGASHPIVRSTRTIAKPRRARKGASSSGTSGSPSSKKLVFGLLDKGRGDSNLVFIQASEAKRLAKVHYAIENASDWGTFRREMPAEDLKYVIEHYRDRGKPLPRKGDGFVIPGSYYDGDWPDWPEQMMLDWMPKTIVEKYGTVECPVFNGHFLTLQMKDAEQILLALKRDGFECRLDEKMVRQACGRSCSSDAEL
jgi:hypothetical protein